MTIDIEYELYGFIEYLPNSIGFLSPVFKSGDNYYMQNSYDNHVITSFLALPPSQTHLIQQWPKEKLTRRSGQNCVFGFKKESQIFFAEGKVLARQLITEVHFNDDCYNQVQRFIDEFKDDNDSRNLAESVWRQCLNIIASQSRVFKNLFEKNFMPYYYATPNLYLYSKNPQLKDILRNQFFPDIHASMLNKYGDKFNIIIHSEKDSGISLYDVRPVKLNESPHLKHFFSQKREMIPGMTFQNYFTCKYNLEIYNLLSHFVSRTEVNGERVFVLLGPNGSGKTHLLHALAKEYRNPNIYPQTLLYTIPSNFFYVEEILQEPIDLFQMHCRNNDIVIIDDAQFIFQQRSKLAESFIDIISSYIKLGKKFILGYQIKQENDNISHRICVELNTNVKSVSISLPGIQDKIDLLSNKLSKNNLTFSDDFIKNLSYLLPPSLEYIDKLNVYIHLLIERNRCENDLLTLCSNYLKHRNQNNLSLLYDLIQLYFTQNNDIKGMENISLEYANATFICMYLSELLIPNREVLSRSWIKDYSYHTLTQVFFLNPNFKKLITNIFKFMIDNGWQLSPNKTKPYKDPITSNHL
ncbi:DnaA ATPase domain-containing protein [Chitinophaga sp. LS1]|uniref:DnaA ATPase domain-containing protein n=1 Tax=Chitinophaga sp. LS1 TaxID=3051176 RepID=UPI002AABD2E5|nr:DnaA/Hda family protein [Chitinophaga sp. LS1]WPV67829.1 DnaA/Hda family protein [Chitinophaga sp. LS1]